MVSDAVVARLRGMLNDIARQLIASLHDQLELARDGGVDPIDYLADILAADPVLVGYLHAVAIEALITERLEQRASIDPVLSPLWQELIASSDPQTAEIAMQALAAQSRFMQAQRRRQHPVSEMPPATFDRVLRILDTPDAAIPATSLEAAKRTLKSDYDEAQSREGLLARLVTAMRGGAIAALELDHAGLALFVSVLADRAGLAREKAVLACHERQIARLALSLRAAGLDGDAIERQFLILEPSKRAPSELGALPADTARALLLQTGFDEREAAAR